MKFPHKFEIDIRNEKDLAILWACFNISYDNVVSSLNAGGSENFKGFKKIIGNRNSRRRNFYLDYKTVIWNRLERMVNELKDN